MENTYHASYEKYVLHFKKPAGTSRGYLDEKTSYFISVRDNEKAITGTGECSIIPGLSIDDLPDLEEKVKKACDEFNAQQELTIPKSLETLPALHFAFETAILDLKGGGKKILFDNAFSCGEEGIPINGLIWMSQPEEMWKQVQEKVTAGFNCIKLKVGALNLGDELGLLDRIRSTYGPDLELRLDANGAFLPSEAETRLKQLAAYRIHSIEQPIKQGQWKEMARLCRNSPIPIALDEELIGITDPIQKSTLLQEIKPQYIILKPSLIGGLKAANEWISLAENNHIGWWATSALESNIGLNAIAQWVAGKQSALPQGLGTGVNASLILKVSLSSGDKISFMFSVNFNVSGPLNSIPIGMGPTVSPLFFKINRISVSVP